MREQREIKPLLNDITNPEIEYLKEQIRLTNAILRETHNHREFKQNKAHLSKLERKLKLLNGKVK